MNSNNDSTKIYLKQNTLYCHFLLKHNEMKSISTNLIKIHKYQFTNNLYRYLKIMNHKILYKNVKEIIKKIMLMELQLQLFPNL